MPVPSVFKSAEKQKSLIDLAEQRLRKDFKPASELPSHLYLLNNGDLNYNPQENYVQMFYRTMLENESVQDQVEATSKSNY